MNPRQPRLALLTGPRILYLGIVGHVLAGIVHLVRNTQHAAHPYQYVFEAVVLLGIPLLMFGCVRAIGRRNIQGTDYWRLVIWGVGTTITALAMTGLYLLDIHFGPDGAPHPDFVILLAADVGGLFGLVAGWQEVRVRRSAERAQQAETRAKLSEQHEQSLTFLNRILRHHVLNGMQVILGTAESLEGDVRDDQRDALRTIRVQGEHTVQYVREIESIVRTLSGDISTKPVDLADVLEREVDVASKSFPEADCTLQAPREASVRGTELLGLVFENLLENAIKHNDSEAPRVEVHAAAREGTVLVTIADNGPGIPDAYKDAYFKRGEHGENSLGEGLGLYLAEAVVSKVDGRIWIENNEPRGTRVRVELKRVDHDPAVSQANQPLQRVSSN